MRKYYVSDNGYVEKSDWKPECWINVECPDDDDYRFLRETLHVPESFIESATDMDERPRFDHEDDWLLTITRVPRKSKSDPDVYDTVTLAIITKNDLLLTISLCKSEMIDDFIEHSKRRHIAVVNKPDFILRLIFSSTYWYLNYLKEINTTVTESVRSVRTGVRNELLYSMMTLQKSLVYFNTSLKGNTTLVERLNKMFSDDCDPELLDDVEIELQQAQNTVNIYIDILDSTMDTLSSVISNNVNEIMKKMTSISIILMLPTLIASFYGMNVAVAFGASPHAFWGIIGFSLAVALVIYLCLRKIKWI